MPNIPKVAEVNQPKSMVRQEHELKAQEEQLKVGRNGTSSVRRKKVDVTFQLGNPNVNKVEVPTASERNQLLFQKTFGSLNTTEKVLDQVQNLFKLLSNPRVHVEQKKDIQYQILTLLKEIENIALKSKMGNINLLGQFSNKPIKLPISENGKVINMRTYDILKDIHILKELLHQVPNEKMIDQLSARTKWIYNNIREYQGFLKQIATQLGQGNQSLFQKTITNLDTTTNVLAQIQNVVKLLLKSGVHAETKKDVQTQVLSLLSEMEQTVVKSKIGNINLLGQLSNKPIQLSEEGKKINIRTYDMLKDIGGIKELINGSLTDKNVDRLLERIGLMQRHVSEYQEFLKQVTSKLEKDYDLKMMNDLQSGMSSAEASKMSDNTRAIILSTYGVTFFSQLEKRVKEFLTSPLGYTTAICVIIIIVLYYRF